MKLCLTPSVGSGIYDTHDREMRGRRIRDRKMAKDPHDSRRKNELVTGRHILIDIYEGYGEVRGKINRKSFKKGYKKLSRRLYDRVIVR